MLEWIKYIFLAKFDVCHKILFISVRTETENELNVISPCEKGSV